MTRVGVVGHVEWVQFAVVERVPRAGEIVHARETFSEPAGGGSVAAVQLRKLAGSALFLTALGNDAAAAQRRRAAARALRRRAVPPPSATRRSGARSRTSTTRRADDHRARRADRAGAADPLPWERLAALDAIYLTGGDAGAVRAARAARVLVATPRAMGALAASGVQLDVLVRSASDPGERYEPGMLDPPPRWVVSTRGERRRLVDGRDDRDRGRPRRCRGRRSTPTAAATRSPPRSPTGWARGCRCPRRSSSRRAAGRRACRAAGRTRGSSSWGSPAAPGRCAGVRSLVSGRWGVGGAELHL